MYLWNYAQVVSFGFRDIFVYIYFKELNIAGGWLQTICNNKNGRNMVYMGIFAKRVSTIHVWLLFLRCCGAVVLLKFSYVYTFGTDKCRIVIYKCVVAVVYKKKLL